MIHILEEGWFETPSNVSASQMTRYEGPVDNCIYSELNIRPLDPNGLLDRGVEHSILVGQGIAV